MSEFYNLPLAGTSDLQPGAVLVLTDRRMITVVDVVRYSSLDAIERSFQTGRHHHSPALGPIQFVACIDEATGKRLPLKLSDLQGARLLRPVSRRAA